MKPIKTKRTPKKTPTSAVFEDIIQQFVDRIEPAMNKVARAKGRNNSEFCCVIGPTINPIHDDDPYTMNVVDRQELVYKLSSVDKAASDQIAQPLDPYMVRITVFLKGVIFVKDVYFMPAPNSRGGTA